MLGDWKVPLFVTGDASNLKVVLTLYVYFLFASILIGIHKLSILYSGPLNLHHLVNYHKHIIYLDCLFIVAAVFFICQVVFVLRS